MSQDESKSGMVGIAVMAGLYFFTGNDILRSLRDDAGKKKSRLFRVSTVRSMN